MTRAQRIQPACFGDEVVVAFSCLLDEPQREVEPGGDEVDTLVTLFIAVGHAGRHRSAPPIEWYYVAAADVFG